MMTMPVATLGLGNRGLPRKSTRTMPVAVLAPAVLVVGGQSAVPKATGLLYLDTSASVSSPVEDLLHRMPLQKKIGQIHQIVVGALPDSTHPPAGNCKNPRGTTD